MSGSKLTEQQAATEVEGLRAEIAEHNHRYYNLGEPGIADKEYDQLFSRLAELEEAFPALLVPDSPTQRVGAPLPEGESFEKVAHEIPMLSIESLFDEDGVREFEKGVLRFLGLESGADLEWSAEPKFDGISASLFYEDGVFVRGVTRGNGSVGEDITQNLRTVRNLPLRLREVSGKAFPKRLEVRGEVLMARDAFGKFNEQLLAEGRPTLANPRNASAGALRRNDPSEVARYPLELHVFGAPQLEGGEHKTHTELMAQLGEWGLPDSGYGQCVQGIEACLAYRDELLLEREQVPFEMDGVVAKLNALELRERLGATSRATRWQFAYKFPAIEATTRLLAVEAQVGANGRLTPRAHVEAVEVGGVTVRHVTMHNADHVAKMDLAMGDRVFLYRAGDVIPQISSRAESGVGHPVKAEDWQAMLSDELFENEDREQPLRRGVVAEFGQPFQMPTQCPACDADTEEQGKYWICPNLYACRPQQVGRTQYFVSRAGFNIESIGPKMIEQLFEAQLMETPADLFFLDPERLVELERWGQKTVDNLLAQLDAARQIPLDRFLAALSIPEVGPATARLLANHFTSLEVLLAADREVLEGVDGIGPEMAAAIREWMDTPQSRALLERLAEGGVQVQACEIISTEAEGPFAGKSVVFTGTLAEMSRAEAKRLVERMGARVVSGISAKVDFLVAGEKAGSKRKKADELGVTVLDEAEFLAWTGRSG